MQNKIKEIILDCPVCGYQITETERKHLACDLLCPSCKTIRLSKFNTKRFIKKRKTELKVIQGSKNE